MITNRACRRRARVNAARAKETGDNRKRRDGGRQYDSPSETSGGSAPADACPSHRLPETRRLRPAYRYDGRRRRRAAHLLCQRDNRGVRLGIEVSLE